MFKEYQDAIPEDKVSIGFANFNYIFKLLTMRGESESGLSTYYIKFRHGKNFFDNLIDRIGQIDLNGSFSYRHCWF